jgi:hypothetical protein
MGCGLVWVVMCLLVLVLSFFLALYGHWEGYDSDGIHSLARIDDNDLDTP